MFPEAPITRVDGLDLSRKFEGMLMPLDSGAGEWGIIYNKGGSHRGAASTSRSPTNWATICCTDICSLKVYVAPAGI